jgi:hypothetical protein
MKHSVNKKEQQQQPRSQYNVEFTSMLRIRPLHKSKEREDHVVLEKAAAQHQQGAVVVLHPTIQQLTSPGAASTARSPSPNKFIHDGQEQEFHFHKILDTTASQESVFYAMGLSMASQAMETFKKKHAGYTEVKSAVVIGMGLADSGKTHTIFGKQKSGSDSEGLAPRMLDSLFSQSKHHISSTKTFGVRMTLLLVDKHEVVQDLLVEPQNSTPNKKLGVKSGVKSGMKSGVRAMAQAFERPDGSGGKSEGEGGVSIEQDPLTNDFAVDATSQVCRSGEQARELLQQGLQQSHASRLTSFGKSSSRGHVVVTFQPVLLNRSRQIDKFGGTICMVDLASKEKGKKARSGQMKDSISSDSTLASLMHCFRTIKHNKNVLEGRTGALDIMCDDDVSMDGSEISCVSEPKQHRPSLKTVPWRQSKVTMLLQPLFSATAPRVGDQDRRFSSAENGTTKVTLLMSAYPGHRDYAEKRSMLSDLEILEGHNIGKTMLKKAHTGFDIQPIKEKARYDQMDIALSYSKSEDESEEDNGSPYKENHLPIKHTRAVAMQVESLELSPMLPPPMAPSHNYARQTPTASAPPVMAVNDFPGVKLPASANSMDRSYDSPPSVNPSYQAAASKHVAASLAKNQPPSRDFIRNHMKEISMKDESASTSPVERSAPALARVTSKPNIRPPPSSETKKTGWMGSSPVRTFTTAVNAGKKQGKRALDKIDQLTRVPVEEEEPIENHVDDYSPEPAKSRVISRNPDSAKHKISSRKVASGMSREFEVEENATQHVLQQKLRELEEQNMRLVDRNVALECKCEALEIDKARLEKEVRAAGRLGRQQEWTQQDEAEWRHSRDMRLKHQDLIRPPLQEHLDHVEQTHQINHRWLETGKQHFGLDFPKWWKGAKELDQRDRSAPQIPELEDRFQLPSVASIPKRPELARKQSGEKRKEQGLPRIDVDQYKRLKKY